MKPEKWIGSKYYGYLHQEPSGEYYLQIFTVELNYIKIPLSVGISQIFIDAKLYKYKQSAIRYIKSNF